MNIKYLVASPGRTGSIFVANTIAKSLGYKVLHDNNLLTTHSDTDPIVYHTHDAITQYDENVIVVQTYRDNIFNAIISAVIAEEYREWNVYTGDKEPFVAVLDEFKEQYIWHKYWNQVFQSTTKYNNQNRLCFENFITDADYICNKLSIPLVKYQGSKSPYTKNNITNINELTEYYLKLENSYKFDLDEFMSIHSKKIIKNE